MFKLFKLCALAVFFVLNRFSLKNDQHEFSSHNIDT